MELEADLRLTSDRMIRTLEKLEALENEKRTLTPGTAEFVRLAREIERLASQVFAQTRTQEQLAQQTRSVTQQTGEKMTPIAQTGTVRELSQILADWRDAERRLAAADDGTQEHTQALADVSRLRDEYHRSYSASSSSD